MSTHPAPEPTADEDRVLRNWPATQAEALEAGKWWPDGLLHDGAPPKTLRELLEGGHGE